MSVRNTYSPYRPLLSGTAIYSGQVSELGTLGLIVRAVGTNQPRILTCWHVLTGDNIHDIDTGSAIYQGKLTQADIIASGSTAKGDKTLDAVSVEVIAGISVTARILNLGVSGPVKSPQVGMRLVKCGAGTGVTEGIVSAVNTPRFTISVDTGFPGKYELSQGGDSGAVWLEQGTLCPVGLHYGGETSGKQEARAVSLPTIFDVLGLEAY